MTKTFSVPRGTSDILPAHAHVWEKIERQARRLLNTYGYREIRTPIFEETELFARSMGQTSDIVQKQMLHLAAQGPKDSPPSQLSGLSLRPENTAAVVRAYIHNDLSRKESLTKLFYIGPMFRGERPQKGRLRQFHQIGVEAIGPGTLSPLLDAEVIALSVHVLESLGLKGFQLKINTLGSLEDKKHFTQLLHKGLKPYVPELCEDCRERFERNVLRTLDCKQKGCREIVQGLNVGHRYLSPESQKYFHQVTEALDSLGVQYEVSVKLVRGLDYYTHAVFEISDPSLGSQDALGAGGRYDNLVSQLGGPPVDAIGFALGMERIILALAQEEQTPPSVNVYIIGMDEPSLKKAFSLLNVLRREGISSDMSYRLTSLKNQMRWANKMGVRAVILIGEDELKRQCVTLKDMEKGSQEQISITGDDYQLLKDKLTQGS